MQANTNDKTATTDLFVSAKDESVRMFNNPILHALSFVHWTTPVFMYIPLIVYVMVLSFFEITIPFYSDFGLFFVGILSWSLFEYLAHRFVFHYHPTSKIGKRVHFLIHGVHHDYPNDSWRLVMPPIISVPLAVLFYFIFTMSFGSVLGSPLYAGFVFGYVCYDTIHYATHHAKFIKAKWFVKLRKHHMDHHFASPDEGFGVSSFLWDFIFNTNFKKLKK
jgi:dihydroceramide fatty acyl 2-hydroxylase